MLGPLAYVDDTVLLMKNRKQFKRQSEKSIDAMKRIYLELNT